jgi:hypothetical protein
MSDSSSDPFATFHHVAFCFRTLRHHFDGGGGDEPEPAFDEAHW